MHTVTMGAAATTVHAADLPTVEVPRVSRYSSLRRIRIRLRHNAFTSARASRVN
jgi:hypothetical protein